MNDVFKRFAQVILESCDKRLIVGNKGIGKTAALKFVEDAMKRVPSSILCLYADGKAPVHRTVQRFLESKGIIKPSLDAEFNKSSRDDKPADYFQAMPYSAFKPIPRPVFGNTEYVRYMEDRTHYQKYSAALRAQGLKLVVLADDVDKYLDRDERHLSFVAQAFREEESVRVSTEKGQHFAQQTAPIRMVATLNDINSLMPSRPGARVFCNVSFVKGGLPDDWEMAESLGVCPQTLFACGSLPGNLLARRAVTFQDALRKAETDMEREIMHRVRDLLREANAASDLCQSWRHHHRLVPVTLTKLIKCLIAEDSSAKNNNNGNDFMAKETSDLIKQSVFSLCNSGALALDVDAVGRRVLAPSVDAFSYNFSHSHVYAPSALFLM